MQEFTNTLYTADNLYVLHGMNSGMVDLIYLDPPFNTKRLYSAPVGSRAAGASFKDMWTWKDVDDEFLGTLAINYPVLAKYITSVGGLHSKAMMAYLTYMGQRMIEMHRVLKDTGSLYLHCDPTASHYLKLLLDEIFGKDNFRNEIVWGYQGTGESKKSFKRKHDTIFFYTKSRAYYFCDADTLEDTSALSKQRYNKQDDVGLYKTIRHKDGRVYKQYYRDKMRMRDVWEIPIVNAAAKERVGYPTQKPLALLHRIIKASSNPGDLVLDPFCGCATTCVAAQQLGRKWIGIDVEQGSVGLLIDRLSDDAGIFKDFIATTKIPVRTDIAEEAPNKSIKERLYKAQEGKCNGCGNNFDIVNLEIDHIIPKSKGGGDYYENYQLLCGNCNRVKGARPMEYLRMQIETRARVLKQQLVFGE
jgi:site-specific DNA-methyltransferase (adenine-specific)